MVIKMKKTNYVIIFLTLMFAFIFSVNAEEIDEVTIEDGVYQIKSAGNENLALALNNMVPTNGGNIYLTNKSDINNQKWYIKNIEDNIYEIRSVIDENYVFDIWTGSVENGANLQLCKSNKTDAQKFRILKVEADVYSFVNVNSGKNIDIALGNIKDGSNVQQCANNGTLAQKFKLEKSEVSGYEQILENGSYIMYSGLNLNKSLRTGDDVFIYDSEGSNKEIIDIEYDKDGYYYLKNNNKLFTNENNMVVMRNKNESDNQKWFLIKEGDYYTFISKTNGKVIDVIGGNSKNNTKTQTFISNKTLSQKFKLVSSEMVTIEEGVYQIKSAGNENFVLALNNMVPTSGGNIYLTNKSDSNNQKWYIKNIEDNIYEIRSVIDENYVFDIWTGSVENGANLQLCKSNKTDAQKFRILKVEADVYSFVNVNSGKNIDIALGNIKDGSNVQQCANNGTLAQKFKLEKSEVSGYEQILENGSYIMYSGLNLNKSLRTGDDVFIYDSEGSNKEIIDIEYDKDGYYYLKNNNKLFTNENNMVVMRNKNESDNQKWFLIKEGDYYTFISKTNGKVIDVIGGNSKNNTKTQTFISNKTLSQKFKLDGALENDLETGYYKILSDGKYLGIDSEIAYNGVRPFVGSTDENKQKWYIKKIKDNLYEIKYALNPNKVLDVSGGLSIEGNNVQLFNTNSTLSQRWYVAKVKEGEYKLISNVSHTYLTIEGNNTKIYSNNKDRKQIFSFEKTDGVTVGRSVEDGYYTIASVLNSNKGLDIAGGKIAVGTNIQLCGFNSTLAQVWKLKYIDNGLYNIISALNPKRALTNVNNNVQIEKYTNSESQKWYIRMNGENEIEIISALNSLNVDVAGGSISNGTNIQLYKSNKTNAQKFILKVYGDTKTYHGIDISRWQGNINWRVFEEEIPNFIIMKIGTSYDQKDVKFETYYANAVRYDIPIGVYTYSYAGTLSTRTATQNKAEAVNDAKREADVTLKWLNKREIDLPVFYDMEYGRQTWFGKDLLTKMAEKFCDTIQSGGYRCGVYANLNWFTNYLNVSSLSAKYPLWIAHYVGPNTYQGGMSNSHFNPYSNNYKYWQFASDGRYNGISTNVDMDFGFNIFD